MPMDKNDEFEIECWYDPGMLALKKDQNVTVNFPDGSDFNFLADIVVAAVSREVESYLHVD